MKFLTIAAAALAICCASSAQAQQVTVDAGFRTEVFEWGGNGRTRVAWRPVIVDGKIGICGAYSSRGGSKYANLSRQAVRDMRIDGDAGAFIRNLGFFAQVSSRSFDQGLRGEIANCRITATPGTAGNLAEFRFGFTPQRYRF